MDGIGVGTEMGSRLGTRWASFTGKAVRISSIRGSGSRIGVGLDVGGWSGRAMG